MNIKNICALSLLIFSATHANNNDVCNLPSPYCDLKEVLPLNDHGWYLNKEWIHNLFQHNKIRNVIEVGSWLGLSTTDIASLLPESGYLYAVDTWLGSPETDYLSELMPTLYEQFLSNMIHHGLTSKVKPVKMTSLAAADNLQAEIGNIDLIYLDAAHDTKSVLEDLIAYYPYVANRQGILCGDDWGWNSVKDAVEIFAKTHNLSLYFGQNFWFLKDDGVFTIKRFIDLPDNVWVFDYKQ